MASASEEKGSQLFSRLLNSHTSFDIETTLLPNLTSRDIVEIYGESGTGKTELLYHFIVRCILPLCWKGLVLEGLELRVIYVDNDCHFNLLRLITILETRLKILQQRQSRCFSSEEVSAFIGERMKLLEIIRCYDTEQFLLSLCSLETLLACTGTKCVMMIDGMTSFYWSDRMRAQNQLGSLLQLYFQVTAVIKKIAQNSNIPVFVTRRKVIKLQSTDTKSLGQSWSQMVTYRLELVFKCSQSERTIVSLSNVTNGYVFHCGIGKFGFAIMSRSREKLE